MTAPLAPRPLTPVQGTLPLAFGDEPRLPRAQLRLVRDDFGPVPTPTAALPPVAGWSARLAIAVVEALDGVRPAGQLVRWVDHDVLCALQYRARARALHPCQQTPDPHRPRRAPLRIRALRWTEPANGVAEVAIVVAGRQRPVVLTLRLEGRDGRWLCVQVGSPDGWSLGSSADYLDDAC
jgi:hypothetical protein